MRRLKDWLGEEACGLEMWGLIFACGFGCFLYSTLPLIAQVMFAGGRWPNVYAHGWMMFVMLPVGAVVEEFVFRFLPIAILALFTPSVNAFLLTTALAAAAFGVMHGGFASLLMQGTGGLLLGVLFLKCGGLHGRKIKAWLAASTAHALINFFKFALFVLASLAA